jgi:hypothetical protein
MRAGPLAQCGQALAGIGHFLAGSGSALALGGGGTYDLVSPPQCVFVHSVVA